MDSKLQKITILVSLTAVLLVSLLVILLNRDSGGNSRGGSLQSAESVASGTGSEAEQGLPGQIGTDLSAFEKDSSFLIRRGMLSWMNLWTSPIGSPSLSLLWKRI